MSPDAAAIDVVYYKQN